MRRAILILLLVLASLAASASVVGATSPYTTGPTATPSDIPWD